MKKYFILLMIIALNGCIAAAGVAGVEGASTVAQERTPGTRLDDNSIAVQINTKFLQKDKNLFAAVATDIQEGRVLLTGKVKDPVTKKDAEELVWQVGGVREVINELKVSNQESFTNYMSDAWISNQIRARMLLTNGIKSSNFGVQTVDRVVYLMGIAQNEKELKIAIEIARRTKNVQKVVSHVILKNDPRRPAVVNNDSGNNNTSNETGYNSTNNEGSISNDLPN